MNRQDISVARAERDASPVRYHDYDPNDGLGTKYLPPGEQTLEQRMQTQNAVGGIKSDVPRGASRATTESRESVVFGDIGEPTRRTVTQTQRINTSESHPDALDRIETHRTQHSTTVGSSVRSRKSNRPLPEFGAGKSYPPNLPDKEEFVVEFNGPHDPLHAQNWPMKKKLYIGAILAFDSLAATFGSSVFSNATTIVATQFGVGREVGTLATSLFVLGYAFGPIVWAPTSELYGRRLPIIIGSFGFGIFSIAVAVAKDLQTIIICRFFSGFFGSCPLAVVAAVFSDMFSNESRGIAIAVFSATVFMGPLLAPFVGGFIVDSYLGWRWTEYITAIMGFTACILTTLFQKESYPPVILVDKASELRRRTKNWGIHAKQEEVEVDLRELVTKNVSRPLRILFGEPIVLLITIYMSFIYGLLYLFLTAYALVFQRVYGFNAGVGSLPYIGMVIGEVIAFITVVLMNPSYVRKLKANRNVPVPEWRLPIVIPGAVLFSAGLFWFGWTGYQGTIPWIVPTLSGLFTGFGIFSVFLQLLNYIVDAYLMFAASAIAGNTFLRSLAGCIFPLFATYMYDGMGIEWAQTLLGCLAAAMVPMPIVFLIYGKKIRGRSKFAPAPDLKLDKQRDEESRLAAEGKEVQDEKANQSSSGGSPSNEKGDGEPVEPVESHEPLEEVETQNNKAEEKDEIQRVQTIGGTYESVSGGGFGGDSKHHENSKHYHEEK